MEQAASVLRQLRSWKSEDLIDSNDFEGKRAQIVQDIKVPTVLSATVVKTALKYLKELKEENLLLEEECTMLKQKILTALGLDYNDASRISKQNWLTTGIDSIEKEERLDANTTDYKYFSYYADFAHQELMLNDYTRTGTYHKAIMAHRADFYQKVVIDVGAGTGILSMFAAMAGAKKVYAVEASDMAETAEKLIQHNHLQHIITVLKGKVEELDIPEKADVLLSEPLGFWLLNEQMIQTYISARDKWLKPEGLMFPAYSIFCIAPSYVPEVTKSAFQKSMGWLSKQDFFGLDFTCIEVDARRQNMERMVVDQVMPYQVLCNATESVIDFRTISVEGLNNLTLPFHFKSPKNILWDAVVMWFDTYFVGSSAPPVCLATAPNQKLTCWYQTLCLLPEPKMSHEFDGFLHFVVNTERTYNITLYDGADRHSAKVVQKYGFTQPVYRYYEHFQDLIWDPALFPQQQPLPFIQNQIPCNNFSNQQNGGMPVDGIVPQGEVTSELPEHKRRKDNSLLSSQNIPEQASLVTVEKQQEQIP